LDWIGRFFRLCHVLDELRKRQRLGKEIALGVLNASPLQKAALLLGFHPLGNHLQIQRPRHLNDVRGNVAGCCITADCVNEGLVDFEVVEMEILQARQAGVAGTEIINRNFYVQTVKSPTAHREAETAKAHRG